MVRFFTILANMEPIETSTIVRYDLIANMVRQVIHTEVHHYLVIDLLPPGAFSLTCGMSERGLTVQSKVQGHARALTHDAPPREYRLE